MNARVHNLQHKPQGCCAVIVAHPDKEWYYRWFAPDVVVGVGYWGHSPQLVLHPQRGGVTPVPWLVADVAFGFNEWHRAQDGTAQGQDWQTWSASMYLYAAACVEQRQTPFFDALRKRAET